MQYEGMVYRPPSEARSFILQVTIGCAHNACTFCTMYKDKQFRIRGREEIFVDIQDVYEQFGDHIRRIFLADGDALIIPTDRLKEILHKLRETFPSAERITSYGAPKDVEHKSDAELKELKDSGLDMVYIGLESGDDEVLRRVEKGVDADAIIRAVQRLKATGIQTSVTLISGLGGKERLQEHARRSAEAISQMQPDYVGFLTLMTDPSAPIQKEIDSGALKLLSPEEVMDEMEIFLSNVDSPGTVFRANHASNYLLLKGNLNEDIPFMLKQVREVREQHGFRKESWRML